MSVEPYPTSWLFYGDPGSWKSSLAAGYPKPMLVMSFDQPGKDRPYWRRGEAGPIVDRGGIPTRLVRRKGRVIIRIESFRNADVRRPEALSVFRRRFQSIELLIDKYGFRTVIVDSITGMDLAARYEAMYKLMKGAKDPRKFYEASRGAIEELIYARLTGLVDLGVHAITIAHVNTNQRVVKKGDEIIVEKTTYNPAAPGQLAGRLPGGFAEVYRCYVRPDRGETTQYIQTNGDAKFSATTQIPATNHLADPTFKSIWEEAEA